MNEEAIARFGPHRQKLTL